MFDHLKPFRTIIVTGPHRSGTTIAAEMIAHDLGLPCWREEKFNRRDIIAAEKLVREGGVIQGPYLLPWTPILTEWPDTAVVYMDRDAAEVERSNQRLRGRKISAPFFNHDQALRLWFRLSREIDHAFWLQYASLADHPLWVGQRAGWTHRQTEPNRPLGY